MSCIYVIRHSKRTGYYLKNFECYLCHLLNKIQQDVVDALKVLKKQFIKNAPFLVTVFYDT